MKGNNEKTMKILFLDNDEMSFAIRQCIARVLTNLPPLELYHATDAASALDALESFAPDVIVADENSYDELEILFDSTDHQRPPVLLQSEKNLVSEAELANKNVMRIGKSGSIDGLRRTLVAATTLAQGRPGEIAGCIH